MDFVGLQKLRTKKCMIRKARIRIKFGQVYRLITVLGCLGSELFLAISLRRTSPHTFIHARAYSKQAVDSCLFYRTLHWSPCRSFHAPRKHSTRRKRLKDTKPYKKRKVTIHFIL